jgi:hypothetical protein
MTDIELLKAAAKAAGLYSIGDETSRYGHFMGLCIREGDQPSGYCWNPLFDDGDTLRLAVRLEMDVFVRAGRWTEAVCPMGPACKEPHGTDPAAATRRAIVRAAAAMAKP